MKTAKFIFWFIALWIPTKLAISSGAVKRSTTMGEYIAVVNDIVKKGYKLTP